MNVCIFYYDGFCEFEVVISAAQFRNQNLFSAALEKRIYVSEETQKFVPDITILELNPEEIDLFIIPGGDPSSLFKNKEIKAFLSSLNEKGKYIAGICGGTELMAKMGVLDNKKCTGDSSGIRPESYELYSNSIITNEDIVIDGNTITSVGGAYCELAFELGKLMNIFESEEERINDYKWFKNMK